MELSRSLIQKASRYLAPLIRKTPVEESPELSHLLGQPVYLKLECLQITGSFKVRGALFALKMLSESKVAKGVTTCSAGNHGWALAYAAARRKVAATIYVPSSVDRKKLAGMQSLGAKVIRSGYPGYDETEQWARQQAASSGLTYISAFDDPAIMAANGGSLASEVLEQVPEAENFVLPVGGGGLAAGFSFWAKNAGQTDCLIGCQHQDSPALKLSLQRGQAVTTMPPIETVAGGIEGGIGLHTFEILKSRLNRVALVSERQIWGAVRWMLFEHRYLIEPSAAVTIAACLQGQIGPLKGPTVVVLSGRNVSGDTLQRILAS